MKGSFVFVALCLSVALAQNPGGSDHGNHNMGGGDSNMHPSPGDSPKGPPERNLTSGGIGGAGQEAGGSQSGPDQSGPGQSGPGQSGPGQSRPGAGAAPDQGNDEVTVTTQGPGKPSQNKSGPGGNDSHSPLGNAGGENHGEGGNKLETGESRQKSGASSAICKINASLAALGAVIVFISHAL